jgi:fructose-bisphosphate aldolase, class II
MLVTLSELLRPANSGTYAVPCFNVFGNEEALAITAAAQALNIGVILACNKEMADFVGVAGFHGMVKSAALEATVPVCIHLDHCDDEDRILAALKAGFTSVMYDGSQLPLQNNIQNTFRMAQIAHDFAASIEGEIGSVPYFEGRDHIKSELTLVHEAKDFAEQSGVDAMAISVGNVHRLRTPTSTIDFQRLAEIESCTTLPLVIHGTTGISDGDLLRLKQTRVSKFNVSTSMRRVFTASLRQSLAENLDNFDRLTLMRPVVKAMQNEADRVLRLLGPAKLASK